jgi:hypothetical protein
MMPIAIVPRDVTIPWGKLAGVASAIQMQLALHVRPHWGVEASVAAFPSIAAVPDGYAFVYLVRDARGQAGLHFRPEHEDEPPMALVTYGSSLLWTHALSHEVIEMAVDPLGNRLFPGSEPGQPTRQVDFLAEICDPCQDLAFAYEMDGHPGIFVCDFCLPAFYGFGTASGQYTFRQAVSKPLSVAAGGYLSWRTADRQWFQLTSDSGEPCGPIPESQLFGAGPPSNLRGELDRMKGGYRGPAGSSRTNRMSARAPATAGKGTARRNRLMTSYLRRLGV